MVFIFESYAIGDYEIEMVFLRGTDRYTIRLTDAELAAVATQQQLRALVVGKLQRKIQAAGIAAKLDQFVGQPVTI